MGELLKLPDNLAEQKQLAVQVRVEGVKGVADSAKNRARVEKKLCVEGLLVTVREDKEGLFGVFEVGGKKIKFSKSKEATPAEDVTIASKDEKVDVVAQENGVDKKNESKIDMKDSVIVQKEVKAGITNSQGMDKMDAYEIKIEATSNKSKENVEEADETVPLSAGKPVMFSKLPDLKLLEGIEISGTVVYVSPLGQVWFCPQWIQAALDALTMRIDSMGSEKKLENVKVSQLQEGMLCVARSSQDGDLYRARVVAIDKKLTVKYIDFGDIDVVAVTDAYDLPSDLELLAPAAVEVVPARELPKQRTKEMLEDTLMEVENLVLVLEKEKTEARVGKFYVGGKEIKWDSMVETKVKEVFEKDREVDQENNEDVVIELESGPNIPEIKSPEYPVQAAVKSMLPPTTKLSSSPPKLIRMVPPVPFELKEVPVFIV